MKSRETTHRSPTEMRQIPAAEPQTPTPPPPGLVTHTGPILPQKRSREGQPSPLKSPRAPSARASSAPPLSIPLAQENLRTEPSESVTWRIENALRKQLPADALRMASDALEEDPTNFDLWNLGVEAHIAAGNSKTAQAILLRNVAMAPDRAILPPRAAAMWAELKTTLVESPETYVSRGVTYLERGAGCRAASFFGAALILDPNNNDHRVDLADALVQEGNTALAEHVIGEVLQREPDNAERALELAAVLSMFPDWQAAYELVHKVHAQHPNNDAVAMTAVNTALHTRRLDEASTLVEGLLRKNGRTAVLLKNLGTVHLVRGEYTQAEQALRESLAIDPSDAVCHARLGHVYLEQDLPGADAAFAAALALDAHCDVALAGMSVLATKREDLDEAERLAQGSIGRKSPYPEGYCALALVQIASFELPEAEKSLESAIARGAPAELLVPLAFAHHEIGGAESALEIVERALTGGDLHALNPLAGLICAEAACDDAFDHDTRILALRLLKCIFCLEPNNEQLCRSLGEACWMCGDYAGAAQAFCMANAMLEGHAIPPTAPAWLLQNADDAQDTHTMGATRLNAYCAQRLPMDNILSALRDGPRQLHTVAQLPVHFETDDNQKQLGITNLERLSPAPSTKTFNAMRPVLYSGNVHGQPALFYVISPGPAYFAHQNSMLTHLTGLPWERLGPAPGAEVSKLLQPLNDITVRAGDIVVMGSVQHLRQALAEVFAWPGMQVNKFDEDQPLYGAYRYTSPQGQNLLFLGVKYSYWGDLAGDIAAHLAQRGCREIIYCAKLGSMTKTEDLWDRIYSPTRYAVFQDNQQIAAINNVPSGLHQLLQNNTGTLHVSVPTMLEERCEFARNVISLGAESIDNELGYMALALQTHNQKHHAAVALTALHYATDLLEVAPQPGSFATGLECKRDDILRVHRHLAAFRQAYALNAYMHLLQSETPPAAQRDPFAPPEVLLRAERLRALHKDPHKPLPQLQGSNVSLYYRQMLKATAPEKPPVQAPAMPPTPEQVADAIMSPQETYAMALAMIGSPPPAAFKEALTWPHETRAQVDAFIQECHRINREELTPDALQAMDRRGADLFREKNFGLQMDQLSLDAMRVSHGRDGDDVDLGREFPTE